MMWRKHSLELDEDCSRGTNPTTAAKKKKFLFKLTQMLFDVAKKRRTESHRV
jgi:hypothetical protein